jgi:hypothetical protein
MRFDLDQKGYPLSGVTEWSCGGGGLGDGVT